MRLPPHRIDVQAGQLAAGLWSCLATPQPRAGDADDSDLLCCLSARSAFDLLLSALAWPPGAEVLCTAITIQDMADILVAHGLVPVAVEVEPDTLTPCPAAWEAARTGRTRALLVTHLFGGTVDMAPLSAFARQHQLLLIDDRAQAFGAPTGPAQADVTLWSFGLLKTATACGGGIARVVDPDLRGRMRLLQAAWPQQTRGHYARRLLRAALLAVGQRRGVYRLLAGSLDRLGRPVGASLRAATRGFAAGDAPALLEAIRRRPCAALQAALRGRLDRAGGPRLGARTAVGASLAARLRPLVVGGAAAGATWWVLPVSVSDPDGLRARLLAAGFDASGASNVVALAGAPRAADLVRGLVFLPCYPELTDDEQQQLVATVLDHQSAAAAAC